LDLATAKEICEQVSGPRAIAVPANLNAPGQVVIAGHAAPVRRAVEIARERGAGASQELKVSAPFHSPLMEPARVVPLLIEQITAPVRWEDSMKTMVAAGVTDAIEFGGRVLMGLMRRIDRNVKVKPLEDLASLKSIKEAWSASV